MDDRKDVELRLHTFYKTFNYTFRTFNSKYFRTFLFLSKSYCLHGYGFQKIYF